jgi:CHAT domain-containing protein
MNPGAAYKDLSIQISELDDAIETFRRQGQDPLPVISAQSLLKGKLAEAKSDYEAAVAAYQSSLEGFRQAGMEKEAATVALGAARMLRETGELTSALVFCQEAVRSVDTLWHETSLQDRQLTSAISVETYDFSVLVAHCKGEDRQTFEYIQKAKSRWLNDAISLDQTCSDGSTPVCADQQNEQGSSVAERSAFLVSTSNLDQGWNEYLAGRLCETQLAELEQRLLNSFNSLTRSTSSGWSPSAATYSFEDIQARLQPHEALLDFFVQTDGVFTVLIRKTTFNVSFQPIPATQVRDLAIMAYLNLIQNQSRRDFQLQMEVAEKADSRDLMQLIDDIFYQEPEVVLQALYDRILQPLAAALTDASRLIICPHWVLHVVPFQAMGRAITKGELIISTQTITYCPNATIWARLRDAKSLSSVNSKSKSLVFGVEKTSGSKWWQGVQTFLGHLRDDAHLSDFVAEAKDVANSLQVSPVLNQSATKARLLQEFPSAKIVHLSCHSAGNRNNVSVNGLLLADGILTIAEILTNEQINQSKPTLISLSACRSGIDRVDPGDQLHGIGYAFMARCGSCLLTSMWPIDAEATRLLMSRLYDFYPTCGDWAEALRQAQLATRQSVSNEIVGDAPLSFDDPYFWSGFYVIGA